MPLLKKEDQQFFYEQIESKNGINKVSLIAFFAYFENEGARFKTTDLINLEQKRIGIEIKEGHVTTVGQFLVNKFLFEDLKIFGYVYKPNDGNLIKKIDECLSDARLLNRITQEQWFNYIDRTQWLYGGILCDLINPSASLEIMRLPDKAKKRRNELFKQYAKELDEGDAVIASKIEKEVVDIALAEMRKTGDPAIDVFDSKCGIDPYNNYKTLFVMKGPIQDANVIGKTKYNIVKSSLDEGITKDEFPYIADSITLGAYARGKLTGISGYESKKYDSLFKDITIEPGSDCGSTEYFEVTLTPDNLKLMKYMNFVDNGKLVTLVMDNTAQYMGKTLKFRHPAFCKHIAPKYCETCFGIIPRELGVKNIGLWAKRISNSQMNANLKVFHDISIKLYEITEADVLGNYKE